MKITDTINNKKAKDFKRTLAGDKREVRAKFEAGASVKHAKSFVRSSPLQFYPNATQMQNELDNRRIVQLMNSSGESTSIKEHKIEAGNAENVHPAGNNSEVKSQQEYIETLLNFGNAPALDRGTHLKVIVEIANTLQKMATEQGEEFDRGSLKIIDPGHKLFNFLNSYYEKYGDDGIHMKIPSSSKEFAYHRISSHYKGEVEGEQTGIDIRYAEGGKLQKDLPGGQKHLLFGKLASIKGEDLMFMKFEGVGNRNSYRFLEAFLEFYRA